MRHWGRLGAFWGTVFGILFAPAFFWIPGVGPILTGGLIGSVLMGTVEGAAAGAVLGGGASVLAAALSSIGIPKDSVIRYETAVMADKYLLIASGTPDDIERARTLLGGRATTVDVHDQA